MSNGIVQIQKRNKRTGQVTVKDYQTVAFRIKQFREEHPGSCIETEILHRDDECVLVRCKIVDREGLTIATGHAEEWRDSSDINRTSAVENAETSAIGRALAAFGLLGEDIATGDEVQAAIARSERFDEIANGCKEALEAAANNGMEALQQAWESMSKEQRVACRKMLPGLKQVAQSIDDSVQR